MPIPTKINPPLPAHRSVGRLGVGARAGCGPGGIGAVRPTVTTATPSFNSAMGQGKQLAIVEPTWTVPTTTVSCFSL